jgi:hypothetical protein
LNGRIRSDKRVSRHGALKNVRESRCGERGGGWGHLPEQVLDGLYGLGFEGDGYAGTVPRGDCRPDKVGGKVPLCAGPLQMVPPELELEHKIVSATHHAELCKIAFCKWL